MKSVLQVGAVINYSEKPGFNYYPYWDWVKSRCDNLSSFLGHLCNARTDLKVKLRPQPQALMHVGKASLDLVKMRL